MWHWKTSRSLPRQPAPWPQRGEAARDGRGCPREGRARRTAARAYPCPAQPRGSSERQGRAQGQKPRRLSKPRVAFHFGKRHPRVRPVGAPRFRARPYLGADLVAALPGLDVHDLTHGAGVRSCPYCCYRLVPRRSRTRSCGGRAPRCPLNRAARSAPPVTRGGNGGVRGGPGIVSRAPVGLRVRVRVWVRSGRGRLRAPPYAERRWLGVPGELRLQPSGKRPGSYRTWLYLGEKKCKRKQNRLTRLCTPVGTRALASVASTMPQQQSTCCFVLLVPSSLYF